MIEWITQIPGKIIGLIYRAYVAIRKKMTG